MGQKEFAQAVLPAAIPFFISAKYSQSPPPPLQGKEEEKMQFDFVSFGCQGRLILVTCQPLLEHHNFLIYSSCWSVCQSVGLSYYLCEKVTFTRVQG